MPLVTVSVKNMDTPDSVFIRKWRKTVIYRHLPHMGFSKKFEK